MYVKWNEGDRSLVFVAQFGQFLANIKPSIFDIDIIVNREDSRNINAVVYSALLEIGVRG